MAAGRGHAPWDEDGRQHHYAGDEDDQQHLYTGHQNMGAPGNTAADRDELLHHYTGHLHIQERELEGVQQTYAREPGTLGVAQGHQGYHGSDQGLQHQPRRSQLPGYHPATLGTPQGRADPDAYPGPGYTSTASLSGEPRQPNGQVGNFAATGGGYYTESYPPPRHASSGSRPSSGRGYAGEAGLEEDEGEEEDGSTPGGVHEGEDDEEQYTAEVWDALDGLEQIRPTIRAGPRWKLETFLEAMEILDEAREVLGNAESPCPKGFKAAEELLSVALGHLLEEFRDAMGKNSKPPPAEVLREVAMWGRAGQLLDYTDSSPTDSSSASTSSSSSMPRSGSLSSTAQVALQEWLSAAAVPFLHRMAVKLMQGGKGDAAVEAYVKVRAAAIQQTVKELGIKKLTRKSLESLLWPDLEQTMKGWVQDMRVVVLVLIGGERNLADEIFEGLEAQRQQGFLALVRESALRDALELLLGNARSMALGKNCPERLFALLDMFTTVRELRPQVEGLSAAQGFPELLRVMGGLPGALAVAVRDTLAEFESALEEPQVPLPAAEKKKRSLLLGSKTEASTSAPVPEDVIPAGAGVHPVTSYVVNYITHFLERQSKRSYPTTLEYLLLEYPTGGTGAGGTKKAVSRQHTPPSEKDRDSDRDKGKERRAMSGPMPGKREAKSGGAGGERGGGSVTAARPEGYAGAGSKASLPEVTESLLTSLMHNLEARAKAHPDEIVGALFLLNNAAYVHRNMSDPKSLMLTEVPGWKEGKVVDAYSKAFQEKALAKALGSLKEEGDIRTQLKKFNAAFEELAIKQASWAIADEEHRKKTRSSVAARVKQAYSQFLLPHRESLTQFKSYRYTPNSVERVVLDYFFLGTPTRGLVL